MRTIARVGTFAIGTIFMTGCNNDSDLTKLSKEYDDAIENTKTQKEELKDAQEDLKNAQEKVTKEEQDVTDAQNKEADLKIELQKAKINP